MVDREKPLGNASWSMQPLHEPSVHAPHVDHMNILYGPRPHSHVLGHARASVGSTPAPVLGRALLSARTSIGPGCAATDLHCPWVLPLPSNFSRTYFLRLGSIWAILRLVGLRSLSWTLLWAPYGLNLEVSNFNNLHLNSTFGLLLTLRASRSPRLHVLR